MRETGQLLGLPKLSSRNSHNDPDPHRFAGSWDLMSWPWGDSQFLTWHLWKLGWLNDDDVACIGKPVDTTLVLAPEATPGGSQAVVVTVDSHTAYVAEVRRQDGHHKNQCAAGVLVYKVDADASDRDGPINVSASQPKPSAVTCSPDIHEGLAFAPFTIGQGRVSRFTDSLARISITVLGADSTGAFTVRITKRWPPVGDLSQETRCCPSPCSHSR